MTKGYMIHAWHKISTFIWHCLIIICSKQTIVSEKKFDFLRDLVSTVPDHQAEDEGESSNHGETKKQKRYGHL